MGRALGEENGWEMVVEAAVVDSGRTSEPWPSLQKVVRWLGRVFPQDGWLSKRLFAACRTESRALALFRGSLCEEMML